MFQDNFYTVEYNVRGTREVSVIHKNWLLDNNTFKYPRKGLEPDTPAWRYNKYVIKPDNHDIFRIINIKGPYGKFLLIKLTLKNQI